MYAYIKSEPQLFTVGHYAPDGTWHPESDHTDSEAAAARVHYLNGGLPPSKGNPSDLLDVPAMLAYANAKRAERLAAIADEVADEVAATFAAMDPDAAHLAAKRDAFSQP